VSKFKQKLDVVKTARLNSKTADENQQPTVDEPIVEQPQVEEPAPAQEPTQQPEQPTQEEPVQEQSVQEQPAQEEVQEQSVEEQSTEETEEPNEEYTDEDAEKEKEVEYGEAYKGINGQITPWHILFKDLGNDIASLDDNGAVDYVVNFLYKFNEEHGRDKMYLEVDQPHIEHLKHELDNDPDINSGMDVLYAIKEKLLESEGLKKKSNSRLKRLMRG
jgi:hypothetical protein